MKLFRNYFFWAYERGSFHYDVMVTAILLFLFIGPRFIDFKDKPVTNVPLRSSEVLVKGNSKASNGDVLFTYEIRADDLGTASTDAERRAAVMRVIEPIAGEVSLEASPTPVVDTKGNIVAYDAVVRR